MTKNTNILKSFSLSYSAWNSYKTSQLQFYFDRLTNLKPTNIGFKVYGIAGNVTHHSIEDYVNTKKDVFEERWNNAKIDSMRGIGGAKLSKQNYLVMYNKSIEYINDYKNSEIVSEQNFQFDFYGMTIKGQIDLVVKNLNNSVILLDWKTNSKNNYDMHKDQRLFYSWAIWKTQGIIPLTSWIYLKDNKTHNDIFTVDDLKQFEEKIKIFIDEIKNKSYDINQYEAGDWKNLFNNYSNLCAEEVHKRIIQTKQKITLKIKGNFVFIESLDPILEQGIDYATKFDLKDKHFMQEYARKHNKGIINIEDIGVYHLYNNRFKCFPIGLSKKVLNIISEYGIHYKKELEVEVIDYRDKNIMNKRNSVMPKKNLMNIKLRYFQEDAVKIFLEKKQGIIQMGTGAGKTITAAEIIRKLDAQTLWIIDRKELLEQTKNTLEKYLGVEVGVIMGKKCELNKSVTIATIQSLNSKMKDIKQFLSMFNFVIVDEFHKSAAEGYQKVFAKLPHTKYKLGITATPFRNDGKEPVLFSILGDIIYIKSSKELIKEGYLMMPKINFVKLNEMCFNYEKYNEEYNDTIINNVVRNSEIIKIVDSNQNKKILILTKSVNHGKKIRYDINLKNIKCSHIHGTSKTRIKDYDDFKKCDSGIAVFTSSIGQEGLDIPNINMIINAGANKNDTSSIQILGRELRNVENKETPIYYDFVDIGKNTYKHSLARMKIFKKEGYKVNVVNLNE